MSMTSGRRWVAVAELEDHWLHCRARQVGTRSTVANCNAHNPTDHWPVTTYVRLPEKKQGWRYEGNSASKEWKSKTESDDTGFGRLIVGSSEEDEDLMGDISIEDITKKLPSAARAIEFWINWSKEKVGKEDERASWRREEFVSKRWRGTEGYRTRIGQAEKEELSQKNHSRDAEGEEQADCLSALQSEKEKKQRVIGKNEKVSWKDTRGTSIRMRKWEWRRGKNLKDGRKEAESIEEANMKVRNQDWQCQWLCKAEFYLQIEKR